MVRDIIMEDITQYSTAELQVIKNRLQGNYNEKIFTLEQVEKEIMDRYITGRLMKRVNELIHKDEAYIQSVLWGERSEYNIGMPHIKEAIKRAKLN